MDEEIAMPMYTHDDCYFADDAPSGACEGRFSVQLCGTLTP